MFLLFPRAIRSGMGFWPSLGLGCALTILLYGLLVWLGTRFNLPL